MCRGAACAERAREDGAAGRRRPNVDKSSAAPRSGCCTIGSSTPECGCPRCSPTSSQPGSERKMTYRMDKELISRFEAWAATADRSQCSAWPTVFPEWGAMLREGVRALEALADGDLGALSMLDYFMFWDEEDGVIADHASAHYGRMAAAIGALYRYSASQAVRFQCVTCGAGHGQLAIPIWEAALSDPDEYIRKEAREQLEREGSSEARDVLSSTGAKPKSGGGFS